MSRSIARRVVALAVAAAAAVPAAGCGAGQVSQTARMEAVTPGVNVTRGDIAVRNALVAFPPQGVVWPAGSAVPLELRLVNSGGTDDALVDAASPAAEAVRITAPRSGQALLTLPLPARTLVELAPGRLQLVLVGLTEPLRSGDLVAVTLRFAQAGTVTLRLPVEPPRTPLPRTSLVEPGHGGDEGGE